MLAGPTALNGDIAPYLYSMMERVMNQTIFRNLLVLQKGRALKEANEAHQNLENTVSLQMVVATKAYKHCCKQGRFATIKILVRSEGNKMHS